MAELNVRDREELLKSMKLWQRRLNESNKKLSALRRAEEQARKGKQLAQARVERRKSQLAKLDPGPRANAIALALHYVGVTERPAGSNRGPIIDTWQQRFHMLGQPWCGAFVGAMLEIAGKVDVSDRIVYCPYIYEDAKAGRNGLRAVVDDTDTHTGDLVLFDFGGSVIAHVGFLAKPYRGGQTIETIEGNTSFGPGGSQDNGGAVARRTRPLTSVRAFVTPNYRA